MTQPSQPVTAGAPSLESPFSPYDHFHANFEVVLADTPELVDEAMALRYQIYCIERGYEDPSLNPGSRESDEFDPRSVHALIHRRAGGHAAVVRLVLADASDPNREFPIEAHCAPHFFPGVSERIAQLPRLRLAEISRFAVTRTFRRRANEGQFIHGLSPDVSYTDTNATDPTAARRAMPQVTVGLFAAIVQLSVREHITHWYAVMEPTLLRLLGRFGIRFEEIGPAVDYHGRRVPVLGNAFEVVENIRLQRPDVWEVITDRGRVVPPMC